MLNNQLKMEQQQSSSGIYILPKKVIPALKRLCLHYKDTPDESLLKKLISSGRIYILECSEYDNWNGGETGHDVLIFVPDELIGLIDLNSQDKLFEKLAGDINKVLPDISNEYIRKASILMQDDSDPHFLNAIPISNKTPVNSEDVGLWKDNALRVFLSHRDGHKQVAHELADALEPYGVSTFVAHDVIKPMKEWQQEIMNGLATMEVMIILLTDDFHDSDWTNQEAGYALGKDIPIICIKVGNIDPKGFIAANQALKASYDNIHTAAPSIYKTLIDEIGQEERLTDILIEAFISSRDFIDAMKSLKRLRQTVEKLSDDQLQRIIIGYEKNDQLHNCGGIHNRRNSLQDYLEETTGKQLKIKGVKIKILTD